MCVVLFVLGQRLFTSCVFAEIEQIKFQHLSLSIKARLSFIQTILSLGVHHFFPLFNPSWHLSRGNEINLRTVPFNMLCYWVTAYVNNPHFFFLFSTYPLPQLLNPLLLWNFGKIPQSPLFFSFVNMPPSPAIFS